MHMIFRKSLMTSLCQREEFYPSVAITPRLPPRPKAFGTEEIGTPLNPSRPPLKLRGGEGGVISVGGRGSYDPVEGRKEIFRPDVYSIMRPLLITLLPIRHEPPEQKILHALFRDNCTFVYHHGKDNTPQR